MKILHLIDTLSLGGAQRILKDICEKDIENEIYVLGLRKTKVRIDIDSQKVFCTESNTKYSIKPVKKITELIEKYKIEVLHCHLFRAQFMGMYVKSKFFKDIKLIFHEHGRIMGSDSNSILEDIAYRIFLKSSKKFVDTYVAVSQSIKKNLMKTAKIEEDKIVVLYNYVNLQEFNSTDISIDIFDERKKYGLTKDDFVAGFAGRIIKRKGWKELCDSAELLVKEFPCIKFIIAGTGNDVNKLKKYIKAKKIDKNVIYAGYISSIKEFYKILNCLVMPSYYEGLPMTQLEVMALGVPLISTNGPGMDEIPRKDIDVIFCKVKNYLSLAMSIKKLYENYGELSEKLITNSANRVKYYTLVSFLNNLNSIYKNTI